MLDRQRHAKHLCPTRDSGGKPAARAGRRTPQEADDQAVSNGAVSPSTDAGATRATGSGATLRRGWSRGRRHGWGRGRRAGRGDRRGCCWAHPNVNPRGARIAKLQRGLAPVQNERRDAKPVPAENEIALVGALLRDAFDDAFGIGRRRYVEERNPLVLAFTRRRFEDGKLRDAAIRGILRRARRRLGEIVVEGDGDAVPRVGRRRLLGCRRRRVTRQSL